ncbi:MAG: bifunctional UDP-sugar hydrolase/5'-nucleotidase [Nocardioidaceae bacterium]|nr:bifunctional UDP-sugar hydrolase/5'-nucleotidase [Nocardioidaceae bacterium]
MPHPAPHRTRRTTALAAVVALVAAPLTVLAVSSPAQAADPVTVNLLNINDFHGRIAPEAAATANGVTTYSGTVTFAATIEKLRAESGAASTLFLSAGDNIGASLYASSSQQDQPTIDVLNALKLRTSAVGNHEFDRGSSDLTDRVEPAADFSYLGANVYQKGTTTPALKAYETFDVNGVTVGVIGAITQETPALVSPDGIADLDFGDPVDAVNRVAEELSDGDATNGEADVVVAEYHEGAGGDSTTGVGTIDAEIARGGVFAKIATQTSAEVDAIFTGHTHKEYAFDGPVPGGTGTRPIVQTGSYGDNVGQIKLSVDPDTGDVTGYTKGNVKRIANVAPATLIGQYPVLADVKRIVDAAVAKAKEIGSVQVGSTDAAITRAQLGTNLDDRASESTLGNLVGNALRDTLAPERLGGAEIGVVNPGGLRADLDAGPVTAEEANNVLPFANNLNTTTLTGAQLKTMLEQQWQTNADGTVPSRAFLQLGLSDNVSYTYDPAAAQGSHVTSLSIGGEPVDPARGYRVGTFSFLQQGGDNFRVFRDGTNPQDSGLVDFDGWVAYLKANPGLEPSFARRAVAAGALPTTVEAGAATTVALSRLDLTSAGSPANTSVTAQLVQGGTTTDLGSTPVSAGAADVSLTVPASAAAGAATLVLTAAPSGTVVRVPLAVTAAPAPETGPPSAQVNARSKADTRTETVVVAAYARNTDTVPLDVRFTLPDGTTKKFSKVAPGKAAYHEFRTGRGTVPAGVVKVATYKYVGGQGYYKVYDAPYSALTATVAPRGVANGNSYRAHGKVYLTGYYVNRGAQAVSVRLKTAVGDSAARQVKPGKAAYFVVPTGKASTRASRGVVAAYKYVDGRGYYRELPVSFPAR